MYDNNTLHVLYYKEEERQYKLEETKKNQRYRTKNKY